MKDFRVLKRSDFGLDSATSAALDGNEHVLATFNLERFLALKLRSEKNSKLRIPYEEEFTGQNLNAGSTFTVTLTEQIARPPQRFIDSGDDHSLQAHAFEKDSGNELTITDIDYANNQLTIDDANGTGTSETVVVNYLGTSGTLIVRRSPPTTSSSTFSNDLEVFDFAELHTADYQAGDVSVAFLPNLHSLVVGDDDIELVVKGPNTAGVNVQFDPSRGDVGTVQIQAVQRPVREFEQVLMNQGVLAAGETLRQAVDEVAIPA